MVEFEFSWGMRIWDLLLVPVWFLLFAERLYVYFNVSRHTQRGYVVGKVLSVFTIVLVQVVIVFHYFGILSGELYGWLSGVFFLHIALLIVVSFFYSLYHGMVNGSIFLYPEMVASLYLLWFVCSIEFGLVLTMVYGILFVLVMIWLSSTAVSVGGSINFVFNELKDFIISFKKPAE
jgi:hypothetical protein